MKNEIYKILLTPWIMKGNKLDIERTLNDIIKIIAKRDEECLPPYEDPHWEDITQDSRGFQLKNAWRSEIAKKLEASRA